MKPILVVLLGTLVWMNVGAYERTPLGDSIDKATLKLLKEVYEESKDKNVISSPLGVFLLLSLYSSGAGPEGRQEIEDFLGGSDLSDRKQLTESYSGLSNEFSQMDPSFFTLANHIYITNRYDLNETFADVARSYKTEVDKIDFFDNQKAADAINAWAAQKTQGHITNPVSASNINPDTEIALFNMMFFEGEWAAPFDKSKTTEEYFYINKDTQTKKPTMKLEHALPYAKSEDLGATLIELRYKEEGFRTIVVVPDEVEGLPSVLEKVAQKGLLEYISKLEDKQIIYLTFPKFEIKSKLDFKNILPKVGISKIYDEAAIGIIKGESVQANKIFQEAFVKFDEKGAIATAATGAFLQSRMSLIEYLPRIEVKADHPFSFYILHKDKVLFAGTYTH